MYIGQEEIARRNDTICLVSTSILIFTLYIFGYRDMVLSERVLSAIALTFTIFGISFFNKNIICSLISFMLSELVYMVIMNNGDTSLELLLTVSGILIALIRVISRIRYKSEYTSKSILSKIDYIVYNNTKSIKLSTFYNIVLIVLIATSTYAQVASNSSEKLLQLIKAITTYLPMMVLFLTILNLNIAQYLRLLTYSMTATMSIIVSTAIDNPNSVVTSIEYILITIFTVYVMWRDLYNDEIERRLSTNNE